MDGRRRGKIEIAVFLSLTGILTIATLLGAAGLLDREEDRRPATKVRHEADPYSDLLGMWPVFFP